MWNVRVDDQTIRLVQWSALVVVVVHVSACGRIGVRYDCMVCTDEGLGFGHAKDVNLN